MALPLPESHRGPGLRVRFAAVRGATDPKVLEEPLYLPCVIGEFGVDEEFDHRDYSTVSAGEFSVPAPGPVTARRLRSTDLETLTIDWHAYARFLVNPHLSPAAARREITALARSRTPFELVAAVQLGLEEELRMKATIRALRRVLRPGEADTRYYTLSLKEWRDNALERRAAGSGRTPLPTSVNLTAQTTLISLALHFYPDVPVADGWRAIARANGITSWGASTPLAQTARFAVGSKVQIPRKPS